MKPENDARVINNAAKELLLDDPITAAYWDDEGKLVLKMANGTRATYTPQTVTTPGATAKAPSRKRK